MINKIFKASAVKMLLSGLSFLFYISSAKLYSAYEYGQFITVIAVANIVSSLCKLGYDKYIIREMAGCTNADLYSKFTNMLIVPIMLSLIGMVISSFFINVEVLDNPNFLIPITIIMNVFNQLYLSLNISKGKTVRGLILEGGTNYTCASFLIFIIYLDYINELSLIDLFFISTFVSFFVSFTFYCRELIESRVYKNFTVRHSLSIVDIVKARYFFFVSVLGVLQGQLYPILSKKFISYEDVAQLAIAMKISSIIPLFGVGINLVLCREFAKCFKEKNYDRIKAVFFKTSLLMASIGIFSLLLIVVFGQAIISIISNELNDSYELLVIVSIAQTINMVCGPVGTCLSMTKNEHLVLYSNIISFIFLVVLSIIFGSWYGTVGIAIAISISIVISNVINLLNIKRFLCST